MAYPQRTGLKNQSRNAQWNARFRARAAEREREQLAHIIGGAGKMRPARPQDDMAELRRMLTEIVAELRRFQATRPPTVVLPDAVARRYETPFEKVEM